MSSKSSKIAGACLVGLAALVGGCNLTNRNEDFDWTSYGQNKDETHFSPLDQIDATNVARLGLAWSVDVDAYGTETTPLVAGDTMYFASGNNVVTALDAVSGRELWRYDPEVAKVAGERMRAGWPARGVAYSDGRVFVATRDGRVIALDAKSGKMLWSAQSLEPGMEAYVSGPPWVAGDKVVIGFGGADYSPVRGYVTAYDAATGRQAWRFYTVPGDPSKGPDGAASDDVMAMAAKTWTGQWWKYGGGGNVWHAMAYDEKYDQIYLGTGNGFPWNQKIRSPGGGDNLFVGSIVALDRKTGRYRWHYQVNPGNTWDYNDAMDIELATLTIGGKPRDVIMHAPKNGFFYVIDRKDGKLISAEKFAPVNWASRIVLKTGRPVENPAARYGGGKPFLMEPSAIGAHNVQSMAFSPETGLVYIPQIEFASPYTDPENLTNWRYKPGMFINPGIGAAPGIKVPPPKSHLLAWDPVAGKVRWKIPLTGLHNGGTVATGGNLVFQGRYDGRFVAVAADSGRELWSFDVQNGTLSNPITYSVKGKQYVTVITGFRASSGVPPVWEYRQQHRRVLTFALDAKGTLPAASRAELPILDDPKFAVDAGKAKLGAAVFNSVCGVCHGFGTIAGGGAPDLRRSPIPLDADSFRAVVHDGMLADRGMAKFEHLSDAELEALRHYIRQRARETADTPPADTPDPRAQ